MRKKLKKCILGALQKLINRDIDIIENATKEECINHKFAQYLEEELKREKISFNEVDIEYDKYKEDKKKKSYGRKIRPDIIVHKRRSGNKNNLIVIEAKKDYSREADRGKVIDLVESGQYKYALGALISYLPNKSYIKIKFHEGNNNWVEEKLYKNS